MQEIKVFTLGTSRQTSKSSFCLQIGPAVGNRNFQPILRSALLDLAVRRKDRRKLKIPPRLDTALLQLHSVITSSAISRLVNFP